MDKVDWVSLCSHYWNDVILSFFSFSGSGCVCIKEIWTGIELNVKFMFMVDVRSLRERVRPNYHWSYLGCNSIITNSILTVLYCHAVYPWCPTPNPAWCSAPRPPEIVKDHIQLSQVNLFLNFFQNLFQKKLIYF